MRRTVLLLAVAILGPFAATPARAAGGYDYLVQATNRMLEVSSKGLGDGSGAVIEAAQQACSALQLLLKDQQFRRDLARWADYQFRQQRSELKRELSLFIATFLPQEENLLHRAGLSDQAVNEILWSAAALQSLVDSEIDPKRILTGVEQLRTEICEGAASLSQLGEIEQRRRTFRRWAIGTGGVAMVVIDAVAFAPSGGVATASMVLGGAVVNAMISPPR